MLQEVNVYCDESRYSNEEDPYLVIGAIKLLRENKPSIVSEINSIKARHGIKGEVGWKTVSKSKGTFYTDLVDWFLRCDDVLFRCVVANKKSLWSSNSEDAFYVVYDQLLSHWFLPNNRYHVYLDKKKNSNRQQTKLLETRTRRTMPDNASLACMEEVESHECIPIQLVDLLIGCVGYEWNGHTNRDLYPHASLFKSHLCDNLAKGLNRPSLHFSTFSSEQKFNVFWFGE